MKLHPTGKKAAVIGGIAVLIALGVAGTAVGSSDDDGSERPIPSSVLDRAAQAAIAETGGGRVTDTEVDDEESKYEVEVTLDDGSQVDVQLDESFQVVGTKSDPAGEDD